MFKIAFWVSVLAAIVLVGSKVIPVYYDNLKIQNIFEGVTQNLVNSSVDDVKKRVMELLKIQSVDTQALPQTFFENLEVSKRDGKLHVSSSYHVRIWLLGAPQSINPDEEYDEKDVAFMDKLKLRARLDFDFAPAAITP